MLEAYIKGGSVRVLTIVIFLLIDSDHCFKILSNFLRIANFGFKLKLRLSSWFLVIFIPSDSRGVLIRTGHVGSG